MSESGIGRYALLMGAIIKLREKACAKNMGQRENTNDAAVMDAQTFPSREECASGMVQRSNDAAVKVVQIKPSREACARGMERRSNGAASKGAQI